jgi:hypothetical protein
MMFVRERFIIKINDDVMPVDWIAIENYVRIAMNEEVIVGLGGPVTTPTTSICSIKAKIGSWIIDTIMSHRLCGFGLGLTISRTDS